MKGTSRKEKERSTSFYITDKTRQELDYLALAYGECKSGVMRRLIAQAYAIQREKDDKRKTHE